MRVLNDGSVQAQSISFFKNKENIPKEPLLIILEPHEFVTRFRENSYGLCVEFNTDREALCFPEDVSIPEESIAKMQSVHLHNYFFSASFFIISSYMSAF